MKDKAKVNDIKNKDVLKAYMEIKYEYVQNHGTYKKIKLDKHSYDFNFYEYVLADNAVIEPPKL